MGEPDGELWPNRPPWRNEGASKRLWHDPWPILRALLTLAAVVASAAFVTIVLTMGRHPSLVRWMPLVIGVVVVVAIGLAAGHLFGAVFAAGALVALGAIAVWCWQPGWVVDADVVRVWALVALVLLLLTLIAVSRECGRTTLRVAALVALVAVAALTLKVGRTVGDSAGAARRLATALDLRLSDPATTDPTPAEVQAQHEIGQLCIAAGGIMTPVVSGSAPAPATAGRAERCAPLDGADPTSDLAPFEGAAMLTVDSLGSGPIDADQLAGVLAEDRSFGEMFTDGITGYVQAVPGLRDADLSGPASTAAWIAVALLLLYGYRRLEITSGSGDVGPVEIPVPKHASDQDRQRIAQLRTFVIRNVTEPGAVPGSSTLQPVGDLLAATGERGKLAQALITVAQVVLAPPSGYRIEATFAPSSALGTDGFAVMLLVKEARTGKTRETVLEQGLDEEKALRAAGYRAAAWVLERSRWTPSWATWSQDTSQALCKYVEAVDSGRLQLHRLKDAVRTANRSGVLLAMLGQRFELHGEPAAGLLVYLRGVYVHPRYPVVRYRAAISAAAFGCPGWSDNSPLHPELKSRLYEAADALHLPTVRDLVDKFPSGSSSTCEKSVIALFSEIGERLLHANTSLLTRRSILHHSFRRSERRYWLSLTMHWLQPLTHESASRKALRTVNESAVPALAYRRLLAERPPISPGPPAVPIRAEFPLDDEHRRWLELEWKAHGRLLQRSVQVRHAPRCTWQASYNLACAWAIRLHGLGNENNRDRALQLLEDTLNRPFANQLTLEWAEADVDLVALRRGPDGCSLGDGRVPKCRFYRFLNQLRSEHRERWRSCLNTLADERRRAYACLFAPLVEHSHAQVALDARFDTNVVLCQLSQAGFVPAHEWHQPDAEGDLPEQVKRQLDELLKSERELLAKALEDAVPCGAPLPSAAQLHHADAPVVRLSRNIWWPSNGSIYMPVDAPMLVGTTTPPVDFIQASGIHLDYVTERDTVRFILTEQVAFRVRKGAQLVRA